LESQRRRGARARVCSGAAAVWISESHRCAGSP
jgi:hypothetical protein